MRRDQRRASARRSARRGHLLLWRLLAPSPWWRDVRGVPASRCVRMSLPDFSAYRPKPVPAGPLSRPAPKAPKERSHGLKRTKRMKQRNDERADKARADCFGPQSRLVRLQACCVCSRPAPSQAHHWLSRSRGGKDADCVGVCAFCHELVHGKDSYRGISFAAVASYMADAVRAHDCLDYVEPDPENEGAARCYVCRESVDTKGVTP